MAVSEVTVLNVNCRLLLGDVVRLLVEAELLDGGKSGIDSKAGTDPGTDSGPIGKSGSAAVEGGLPFGGRPRPFLSLGGFPSIFLLFVVFATGPVVGALRFRTGFPEASASAGRVGLGRSFLGEDS